MTSARGSRPSPTFPPSPRNGEVQIGYCLECGSFLFQFCRQSQTRLPVRRIAGVFGRFQVARGNLAKAERRSTRASSMSVISSSSVGLWSANLVWHHGLVALMVVR
jgi:hypothetical protein